MGRSRNALPAGARGEVRLLRRAEPVGRHRSADRGARRKPQDLLGRAVAANPANVAAHSNYGNALRELKRLDEALDSYDRALKIKPDYAEAHYNRGVTLQELGRLDEALDELRPRAEARAGLCGSVQQPRQRTEGAPAPGRGAGQLRSCAEDQAGLCGGLQQSRRSAARTRAPGRGAGELRPCVAEQAGLRGGPQQSRQRAERSQATGCGARMLRPGVEGQAGLCGGLQQSRRDAAGARAPAGGGRQLRPRAADQAGLCGGLRRSRQCAERTQATGRGAGQLRPCAEDQAGPGIQSRGLVQHEDEALRLERLGKARRGASRKNRKRGTSHDALSGAGAYGLHVIAAHGRGDLGKGQVSRRKSRAAFHRPTSEAREDTPRILFLRLPRSRHGVS